MPAVLLICLAVLPVMNGSEEPELPKDTLGEKLDLKTIPAGLPELRELPKQNPLTKERVALGRKLFFDPILSGNGKVSCASCHQPKHGFASPDVYAIGIGGRVGKRNAPSLLNRAFGKTFFWDGRSRSLEEQAVLPIVNKDELGNSYEALLKNLQSDKQWVQAFAAAFEADSQEPEKSVTKDNIGLALAAFQRVLLLGNSPIDAFQMGDHGAMSTEERQGFWLFESRAGCWKCHSGSNYADEKFHNTGVSFGTDERDEGRFEATKKPADKFQFKTPSLRGVLHTAPYMHDGSIGTLKEVVDFYNKGGSQEDPLLDSRMKPLGLSEKEVGHLVKFLEALSRDVDVAPAKAETSDKAE